MQNMNLQWKEFGIDLEALDTKLRADHGDSYKGNQAAGSSLELWFDDSVNLDAPVMTQEPVLDENDEPVLDENDEPQMTDHAGPSIREAIEAWWNGLASDSAEAQSYRSAAQIAAAIQTMKDGIPAKTWNQLIALERKLVLGQLPTKAELIAAELL